MYRGIAKIIYMYIYLDMYTWLRVAQSCPTPWTVVRQAPLSMDFSRQEYCSGLPFPPPGKHIHIYSYKYDGNGNRTSLNAQSTMFLMRARHFSWINIPWIVVRRLFISIVLKTLIQCSSCFVEEQIFARLHSAIVQVGSPAAGLSKRWHHTLTYTWLVVVKSLDLLSWASGFSFLCSQEQFPLFAGVKSLDLLSWAAGYSFL